MLRMKQKRPTRSGSRSETGLDQGGHLRWVVWNCQVKKGKGELSGATGLYMARKLNKTAGENWGSPLKDLKMMQKRIKSLKSYGRMMDEMKPSKMNKWTNAAATTLAHSELLRFWLLWNSWRSLPVTCGNLGLTPKLLVVSDPGRNFAT